MQFLHGGHDGFLQECVVCFRNTEQIRYMDSRQLKRETNKDLKIFEGSKYLIYCRLFNWESQYKLFSKIFLFEEIHFELYILGKICFKKKPQNVSLINL